jgi:rubrerythrin
MINFFSGKMIMADQKQKFSTLTDILEAALKKEKAAYYFYDSVLKNTSVDILRETLEKLRQEEYKHIRIIEKEIVKLDSA